jgi:hypothetical protein
MNVYEYITNNTLDGAQTFTVNMIQGTCDPQNGSIPPAVSTTVPSTIPLIITPDSNGNYSGTIVFSYGASITIPPVLGNHYTDGSDTITITNFRHDRTLGQDSPVYNITCP